MVARRSGDSQGVNGMLKGRYAAPARVRRHERFAVRQNLKVNWPQAKRRWPGPRRRGNSFAPELFQIRAPAKASAFVGKKQKKKLPSRGYPGTRAILLRGATQVRKSGAFSFASSLPREEDRGRFRPRSGAVFPLFSGGACSRRPHSLCRQNAAVLLRRLCGSFALL